VGANDVLGADTPSGALPERNGTVVALRQHHGHGVVDARAALLAQRRTCARDLFWRALRTGSELEIDLEFNGDSRPRGRGTRRLFVEPREGSTGYSRLLGLVRYLPNSPTAACEALQLGIPTRSSIT
jgi:hypothetical protein